MVVRCTSIIPDLKQAYFLCFACNHHVEVLIEKGVIDEPRICPNCQKVGSMDMIQNRFVLIKLTLSISLMKLTLQRLFC